MAKATIRPVLDVKITLELSEGEARALDALAGYGHKGFLEVFYKHMGRHYLEPHEKHLFTLFAKATGMRRALDQAENVRRQLPKSVVLND